MAVAVTQTAKLEAASHAIRKCVQYSDNPCDIAAALRRESIPYSFVTTGCNTLDRREKWIHLHGFLIQWISYSTAYTDRASGVLYANLVFEVLHDTVKHYLIRSQYASSKFDSA